MGIDDDTYHWVLDEAEDLLDDMSITVEKREPYSQPFVPDVVKALNDQDMSRKNASWVREVPDLKLEKVLEDAEQNHDKLWGYSFIVDATWEEIKRAVENLSHDRNLTTVVLTPTEADPRNTPDMEYQPDPPKNPNAPFSYNPTDDYYTELQER